MSTVTHCPPVDHEPSCRLAQSAHIRPPTLPSLASYRRGTLKSCLAVVVLCLRLYLILRVFRGLCCGAASASHRRHAYIGQHQSTRTSALILRPYSSHPIHPLFRHFDPPISRDLRSYPAISSIGNWFTSLVLPRSKSRCPLRFCA